MPVKWSVAVREWNATKDWKNDYYALPRKGGKYAGEIDKLRGVEVVQKKKEEPEARLKKKEEAVSKVEPEKKSIPVVEKKMEVAGSDILREITLKEYDFDVIVEDLKKFIKAMTPNMKEYVKEKTHIGLKHTIPSSNIVISLSPVYLDSTIYSWDISKTEYIETKAYKRHIMRKAVAFKASEVKKLTAIGFIPSGKTISYLRTDKIKKEEVSKVEPEKKSIPVVETKMNSYEEDCLEAVKAWNPKTIDGKQGKQILLDILNNDVKYDFSLAIDKDVVKPELLSKKPTIGTWFESVMNNKNDDINIFKLVKSGKKEKDVGGRIDLYIDNMKSYSITLSYNDENKIEIVEEDITKTVGRDKSGFWSAGRSSMLKTPSIESTVETSSKIDSSIKECPKCKKTYKNLALHMHKTHDMVWVDCCKKYVTIANAVTSLGGKSSPNICTDCFS